LECTSIAMQGIISINYEAKSSLKLEIYMYKTDFMESPLDNWNGLNWRRRARASFLQIVSICLCAKAYGQT
ncbi:hypothetical protein YC68_24405, partial [Vibrio parahaemolyticus]